jgi:hypothetical protein
MKRMKLVFQIARADNTPVEFTTDGDGYLLVYPTDIVIYLQREDGSPPDGETYPALRIKRRGLRFVVKEA